MYTLTVCLLIVLSVFAGSMNSGSSDSTTGSTSSAIVTSPTPEGDAQLPINPGTDCKPVPEPAIRRKR